MATTSRRALDPDGVEQVADPHSEVAELVRLEAQSIERLARFAKMALDAGLDERQVRLAERQGHRLAAAFGAALDKHPIGAELSGFSRAELVRLFAAELRALEASPEVVEGQASQPGAR